MMGMHLKTDDGVTESTASHVFKSDYKGNKGRDCCLETFGEEDDECRAYNDSLPPTEEKKN